MFFIGNLNVKYVLDHFLGLFSGYAVDLNTFGITFKCKIITVHSRRNLECECYFVIICCFKFKCFKTAAFC